MTTASSSKPLAHSDESGAQFAIEMLAGDPTFGINLDRVQWDNSTKSYVIIEYLLCDKVQFQRGVTPYSSHPNRYFEKNAFKFIGLWQLAQALGARLYLVNYSKKGSECEDEVLLMEVNKVDANKPVNPVETANTRMTRSGYSTWLRALNKRGSQ